MKATTKYCYTPIRTLKDKKMEILRVDKNVERLNLLYTAGENAKWQTNVAKTVWQFLLSSNTLTIGQINSILVYLPKRD